MKALVMIALLTTIGTATAVASGSSDDSHNGISGEVPPAGAFSIPGSDLLFSRADDFRWTLDRSSRVDAL